MVPGWSPEVRRYTVYLNLEARRNLNSTARLSWVCVCVCVFLQGTLLDVG